MSSTSKRQPHLTRRSSNSGFYRRARGIASRAQSATPGQWKSPYTIDIPSITIPIPGSPAKLEAKIDSSLYPDVKLKLGVDILKNGLVRIKIDEVDRVVKKRWDGVAEWVLVSEPELEIFSSE